MVLSTIAYNKRIFTSYMKIEGPNKFKCILYCIFIRVRQNS